MKVPLRDAGSRQRLVALLARLPAVYGVVTTTEGISCRLSAEAWPSLGEPERLVRLRTRPNERDFQALAEALGRLALQLESASGSASGSASASASASATLPICHPLPANSTIAARASSRVARVRLSVQHYHWHPGSPPEEPPRVT